MFVVCFIILCLPFILGQFISQPTHPGINDTVVVTCLVNAPDGHKFKSTVPNLKINESLYSFSFDEITDKLNDIRYYGSHLPDLISRRILRGDISIFYVREQDFRITFTCIAQLDNDTFIEHSLKLNTTQPDAPILKCIPADTMSNNLTDPTIPPTHYAQNQEECTLWKVLFGMFTSFAVIFAIILVFGGVVIAVLIYMYLKKESKKQESNRSFSVTLNSSRVTTLAPPRHAKFLDTRKRTILNFTNPTDNGHEETN